MSRVCQYPPCPRSLEGRPGNVKYCKKSHSEAACRLRKEMGDVTPEAQRRFWSGVRSLRRRRNAFATVPASQ